MPARVATIRVYPPCSTRPWDGRSNNDIINTAIHNRSSSSKIVGEVGGWMRPHTIRRMRMRILLPLLLMLTLRWDGVRMISAIHRNTVAAEVSGALTITAEVRTPRHPRTRIPLQDSLNRITATLLAVTGKTMVQLVPVPTTALTATIPCWATYPSYHYQHQVVNHSIPRMSNSNTTTRRITTPTRARSSRPCILLGNNISSNMVALDSSTRTIRSRRGSSILYSYRRRLRWDRAVFQACWERTPDRREVPPRPVNTVLLGPVRLRSSRNYLPWPLPRDACPPQQHCQRQHQRQFECLLRQVFSALVPTPTP